MVDPKFLIKISCNKYKSLKLDVYIRDIYELENLSVAHSENMILCAAHSTS